MAEAETDAERLRHEVNGLRLDIEAKGRRAINEAENIATPDAMALRGRLAAIDRIEAVVRESAKPLEHISDIRIVHVDGLGGQAAGDSAAAGGGTSVSDQVMNSALKYKLQAPLVDALLDAAGIRSDRPTDTLRP
jgi:uncharacterized membrane protein YqiK